MQRRILLGGLAALPALHMGELLAQGARVGFESQGFAETLRSLGFSAPRPSADVQLEAPDLAENGAAVQIALSSRAPGVRRFYLLAEKNPVALLAWVELGDFVEPRLVTQVKLSQSQLVQGIVQLADGRLLMAQREVKVTLGGCVA